MNFDQLVDGKIKKTIPLEICTYPEGTTILAKYIHEKMQNPHHFPTGQKVLYLMEECNTFRDDFQILIKTRMELQGDITKKDREIKKLQAELTQKTNEISDLKRKLDEASSSEPLSKRPKIAVDRAFSMDETSMGEMVVEYVRKGFTELNASGKAGSFDYIKVLVEYHLGYKDAGGFETKDIVQDNAEQFEKIIKRMLLYYHPDHQGAGLGKIWGIYAKNVTQLLLDLKKKGYVKSQTPRDKLFPFQVCKTT